MATLKLCWVVPREGSVVTLRTQLSCPASDGIGMPVPGSSPKIV